MKKVSLKPPDRMVALQALWDQQGPADLGPCGEWKSGSGSGAWLASDGGAASLQVVSLISTGVCVTSWVFPTERRSSGSVPAAVLHLFWTISVCTCSFLNCLLSPNLETGR